MLGALVISLISTLIWAFCPERSSGIWTHKFNCFYCDQRNYDHFVDDNCGLILLGIALCIDVMVGIHKLSPVGLQSMAKKLDTSGYILNIIGRPKTPIMKKKQTYAWFHWVLHININVIWCVNKYLWGFSKKTYYNINC